MYAVYSVFYAAQLIKKKHLGVYKANAFSFHDEKILFLR